MGLVCVIGLVVMLFGENKDTKLFVVGKIVRAIGSTICTKGEFLNPISPLMNLSHVNSCTHKNT